MTPPYKLIDQATGLVVETDGKKWENMDVAAGKPIELSSEDTRISPGTLVRPDDPPPPQTGEPDYAPLANAKIIHVDGLPKPTTGEQLRALLQGVVDRGGGGLVLDPTTTLAWSDTIVVDIKDVTADDGIYFNFNGARLASTARDGKTPAIRFQSAGGVGSKRHLSIDNFTLYGGGYDTPGCGNGLEIVTTSGAMLLATLTNLRVSWAGGNGFLFKGDFFESSLINIIAKDNKVDGCVFDNNPGIISNIMMYGANLSRNRAYGLRTMNGVQSVDLFGGSFVNNDLGGEIGAIRSAYGVNGENTGEILFDLGWCPYPVTLAGCNLSSNGRQHNPAVEGSKPSRYLYRYNSASSGKLTDLGCYVTPYTENADPATGGGPAPANMAVLAP